MDKLRNHSLDFDRIGKDIEKTLYEYVAIGSYTDTIHEREIEPFFKSLMESFPYFQKHPEDFGLYKIPGDHLDRSVCWALVRGSSPDTICMVHHYDVVGIEDFKTLKDYALDPDKLHEKLKENLDMLSEEAKEDLLSGEYLFCKGGCDMKAGGSIQYTLLREYGNLALEGNPLPGNVLVIGVPDEENLSAGMRGAATLLAELKEKNGFNYKLMINSEPHQRVEKEVGVFSLGTVGKLMPFVYARGSMAHVGKVFEGLNPIILLSEIERRTELNMDFTDTVIIDENNSECSPPPSWIYMKDSKEVYDVSMPINAYGCISVLALTKTPKDVLEKVKDICTSSFQDIIQEMNDAYHKFLENSKMPIKDLPWKVLVSSFDELLEEAKKDCGSGFEEKYEAKVQELLDAFNKAEKSIIQCNYELVDFVFDYINDVSPRVVYGLIPPYYPCISNLDYEEKDTKIKDLFPVLLSYTRDNYNQEYTKEYFFSGICDLSYINMANPEAVRKSLTESMPLFGKFYDIPLEDIHAISMPGINIGPWGKDFHKLSERVLIDDTYNRTPRLVDAAVKYMLEK